MKARGPGRTYLMRRVFDVDVLACPRCRGRLRLVAMVDDPHVIQKDDRTSRGRSYFLSSRPWRHHNTEGKNIDVGTVMGRKA